MKRFEIIDITSMTPREKRRYARHLSQLDRRTDSYHSNPGPVELLSILGGGVIGVAIGATIWSKKKNEALEALCSTFLEHLNEEGEVLARIISGVN